MSKKIIKRSLALSALMAFVITGSAMAAETPVVSEGEITWSAGQYPAGPGYNGFANKTSAITEDFNNKTICIKNGSGLLVDDDSLTNIKSIEITTNGSKTGLVIDENKNIKITKPVTFGGTGDARIEVYSSASVTVDNIINTGNKGMVQLNGTSTAILNNVLVKEGSYFSLQTNGTGATADSVGQFVLGDVTVEKDAEFRLCVYQNKDTEGKTTPPASISGNSIKMTLFEGAVVDFGGQRSDKPDWRGDLMYIDANSLKVVVKDEISETKKAPEVYLSEKGSLKNENIEVISEGNNNTGNANSDLNKLSKIVKRTSDGVGYGSDDVADTDADVAGVQLTQEASSIYDGAEGTVQADGTAKVENIIKNTNTYGITENNALSLMTWRAEMNDMNKRMGELRNAEGQHGVWARMVRGEAEYESVKNQYNQYQLGYDEKLSTDPSWTVGAAFNYTEGDTSYSTGSAENKNVGFSVYGSKLNADGSFIDLIAKYARLENDFDVLYDGNLCSGDYSSNGYSVSAEYGKRFTKENGLWIEPQVELTYGKVGSADYKLGTVDIAQDSIESLVGRVGFSLGKNISKGNVYARASYLYDFEGETAVNFVDGGKPRTMEQDLGGGWWEVGVGANINLSKATYIYADIEKTFGGEVDTNWQWNLGVRYSF